ncbi:MAG: ABC transporter permease [Verrucomicrobiae bacterium]|nr:ABC transporter permease [Verrucomicrobiae bacterium]
MQDLRFALRQLLKNPGFTAVAVLTLALGIGANTAIFSAVDRLFLRPLPVPAPEQLALVEHYFGPRHGRVLFNYPVYQTYERENTSFRHLAAVAERPVGLGANGVTEPERAALVSGNYFALLGVDARLGRTFAVNEGIAPDDAPVVVLDHGLWVRRFGADPRVLGQKVTINDQPFTVIGVVPADFMGTTRGAVAGLYLPLTEFGRLTPDRPFGAHPLQSRDIQWLQIMGRLRDGVTREQAQADVVRLADQLGRISRQGFTTNVAVLPGAQGFLTHARSVQFSLNLLWVSAWGVLLIACGNLANLQLVRAAGRTKDFAIRVALGAGRGRLARELFTENLVLSVLGGSAGIAVAFGLMGWIRRLSPDTMTGVSADLDWRVLGFALVLSLTVGVALGLVPAWQATRTHWLPYLHEAGATAGRSYFGSAFVVFQVALSVGVVVGAGLCLRTFHRLQGVDPGFDPERVVLASFDLGLIRAPSASAREFYDRLLTRVRNLPEVEAASLSANTPLGGYNWGTTLERIEDYQPAAEETLAAEFTMISDEYFRVLRIPFFLGRDFGRRDAPASLDASRDDQASLTLVPGEGRRAAVSVGLRTVIVNEAFARRYWPGQNPIGKRIFQPADDGSVVSVEVIGMVGDMRSERLRLPPGPTLFLPLSQQPGLALTLAVRTRQDSAILMKRLSEIARSLRPDAPMVNLRTLARQRDDSIAPQSLTATLSSVFGGAALSLAGLGLYGVLAYTVSRRTREIGIRLALGASPGGIVRWVLRQGLTLTGLGVGSGLLLALGFTRSLRSYLYEISPLDPVTFAAAIGLLSLLALLACWLPARRAARVEPMEALRTE